jgi:uncharacterized protein (TIGR02147 family)
MGSKRIDFYATKAKGYYIIHMLSIYEYFDYQAFLRDYIDARKKDQLWFSFRYLASKNRMDHSNLIKVCLGKRHISRRNALSIADFLKFTAKEREYFTTLVEFNKAKSETKSRHLLEKLVTIKNVGLKKIEPHQYDYYREWYHTAIYSLLDYYDFRCDFRALAAELNPPITAKKAKESIALLEKLQLIRRDADGRYTQTRKMVTSGQNWHSLAIQKFQEETIKLALHSLVRHPRNVRDFSTLTMALSKSDMEAIREITEQYRKSIIKVIHESGPGDTVYQLNVQIFPMTRSKWSLA